MWDFLEILHTEKSVIEFVNFITALGKNDAINIGMALREMYTTLAYITDYNVLFVDCYFNYN